GGVTQNDFPTRRGLMNRFQELFQFSARITFQSRRAFAARGGSRSSAAKNCRTSFFKSAASPSAEKNASSPFLLTMTPGEPRSIRKFEAASACPALARTDSRNQDSASLFYATAKRADQLKVCPRRIRLARLVKIATSSY